MQKNKLSGLIIVLIAEVIIAFFSENTELSIIASVFIILGLQLLYNNNKHDFDKSRNFMIGMILVLLTSYIPVVQNMEYNILTNGNLEFIYRLINATVSVISALMQLGYVYYLSAGIIRITRDTQAEFLGEKLKKNLKYYINASIVIAAISAVGNLSFYLANILGLGLVAAGIVAGIVHIIILFNIYKVYLEISLKNKILGE